VKLSDLRAQHASPCEITHQACWVDLLRHSARSAPDALRTLVAVSPEQLQAAHALVQKRYAWRGYQFKADQAETDSGEPTTLLAQAGAQLLATLTVRPRSPLYAERSYGDDIRQMCAAGRCIGELVRLAVERGVDWKGALDALVQGAYFVSRVLHALTDIVIEVNPRHVRFYERVFGFSVIATGGICSRVNAPSVLMLLDLEDFGRRVRASLAAR
jgi:hypothetical protein